MKTRQWAIVFAGIIFLLFFVIHTLLVSGYGMNWDEPIHYIRGQIFLRFFLTGKKDFADLPTLRIHYPKNAFSTLPKAFDYENDDEYRRSIYQYDQMTDRLTFTYFITSDDEAGHPPISDILASLSNYVFYQKLGWFGDIESYHLFIVFVSSLLVASIFLFTSSYYGMFAGIVATLSLSLYPLFFAEGHFNIKDPVEAAFYGLTLMSFYWATVRNSRKILFVSSLLAGLALSTKFNILFATITVFLWIAFYQLSKVKSMVIGFFVYPCVALIVLISTWPYLWDDPIGKLAKVVGYYRHIGGIAYQTTTLVPFWRLNTYAIQWVLYATPLVTLFLFLVGVWWTLRFGMREKTKTAVFVFFWFLVPILRVSLPGTGIYGGLRQIMEFVPALAILSGIGAKYLVGRHWLLRFVIIFAFVPITLKIISIHPNQNVYFNSLIGGLNGAKERNFPDWGVTLGSAYQQGMNWLTIHAEPEANVALVKGLLSNVPRIMIRPDINFSEFYWSGQAKKGEYLMEVTDYYWTRDISKEKRTYLDSLEPVYEVKVDSVSILTIWKNDREHTRKLTQ